MSNRSIPGPWLHKLTSIPYLFHMLRGAGDTYADKLHRTYGPLVQVAPRHISVNDVAGVRDVFAVSRRLDRPDPLPFFHNYGAENLVSTVDGDVHQDRRRPLRNIYAAKVAHSQALTRVIMDTTRGMLKLAKKDTGSDKAGVEIRHIVQLALYDIMSFVVYGADHKLNLVGDAEQRRAMQVDIDFQEERQLSSAAGFVFILPQLALWLRRLGLAPKPVDGHFYIDLFSDRLTKKALASLQETEKPSPPEDYECLMQRLYTHFQESGGPSAAVPSLEYILSDSLDNFWAGVSTTSDGLSPLFRYLSLPENVERQQRLREEIRQACANTGISSPLELSAEQLRQLPYLEAVIKETLRLHPPIPFSMERLVAQREGSVNVKGYTIPAGWKISSQAMYMQRKEQVFEDAEEWVPERWCDTRENGDETDGLEMSRQVGKDMRAHFFAFGTGPRMCLGINIAWSMMRGLVAGVYGTSSTAVEDDPGISQDVQSKVKQTSKAKLDQTTGVVQEWISERSRKVWLRFNDIQEKE